MVLLRNHFFPQILNCDMLSLQILLSILYNFQIPELYKIINEKIFQLYLSISFLQSFDGNCRI